MKKNILLTISIVISDRYNEAVRCLESVHSILKTISSELIIVDTSNNEELHHKLTEYTDKIYTYQWENDFSKARNIGLEKASGEWFFYMDDDEWIIDDSPIINFFASGEYLNYDSFNHVIRNYRDQEYTSYIDSWAGRGFRIKEGMKFVSKVHEYISPIPEMIKNIDLISGHSGYVFKTEKDRILHSKRNIDLLLMMREEEPKNLRWGIQLLQEYWAIADWNNMFLLSKQLLVEMSSKTNNEKTERFLGGTYIAMMSSLIAVGDYSSAIEEGEKIIRDKRNSEMTFCYIRLLLAQCYYNLKNYEKSEYNLCKYEEGYLYIKEHPEYERLFINQIFVCETYQIDNLKLYLRIKGEIMQIKSKESEVILTISLLVSKKYEEIKRCLDSLQTIMDTIPSELILVDTSGDTEIRGLIEKYTDKIYEFKWCNDFAKARNVGIDHASGEWFLFLDDDEWFEDCEDLIDFFQSGEYKQYGMANYHIRNFMDPHMEKYSDDVVSRLVKLGNETRFHSKIHEYIAPIEGKCKSLQTMVYHSGYIYYSEEEIKAHSMRNISLLKEMVDEEPKNLRWQIQLAQEYHAGKLWDELVELSGRLLPIYREEKVQDFYSTLSAMSICRVESLIMTGNYSEAQMEAERSLNDEMVIPIAKAYLHSLNAENYYYQNKWNLARKELNEFERLRVMILSQENITDTYGAALISRDAFGQMNMYHVYSIYILCDLKEGRTDSLRKYYEQMNWDNQSIYIYPTMISTVVKYMTDYPYEEILARMVSDMFANKYAREEMFIAMLNYERMRDKYERILQVLANVDSNDWYVQYAKVLFGDKQSDMVGVKQSLESYFMNAPCALIPPEEIEMVMSKNNIDITTYWIKIPFEIWKRQVSEILEKASAEQIQNIKKTIGMKEDIRYDYFRAICERTPMSILGYYRKIYLENALIYLPELVENGELIQNMVCENEANNSTEEVEAWKMDIYSMKEKHEETKRVVLSDMSKMNLPEMTKCFWNYAYATLDYAGNIYVQDIFESGKELLPQDIRAAIYIMDMFNCRSIESRLACLREIVGIFGALNENIKRMAFMLKKMANETEEMTQMVEEMKQKILGLAEIGDVETSQSLICEIRKFVPFDMELIGWETVLM